MEGFTRQVAENTSCTCSTLCTAAQPLLMGRTSLLISMGTPSSSISPLCSTPLCNPSAPPPLPPPRLPLLPPRLCLFTSLQMSSFCQGWQPSSSTTPGRL